MTLELTIHGQIQPLYLEGDYATFINDLNLAAAQGKQYVLATEARPDGVTAPVGIETKSITLIRESDAEDAFIGR